MLTSLVLNSPWSRFIGKRTRKRGLDLLPADILLDEIMFRLDLKDIFSLRRVNKALCMLTRQPAIWKRFLPYLSTVDHPLAAMPPTSKYTAGPLSALAIERFVTRAVSLDNNWRGDSPRPFDTRSYETYHKVLAMVLLPGGHYMIASVVDRVGQYAIMVWAMDHPALGGPIPLAIRYTDVKAYHLQAKYMTVGGRKGIAIAFLRKKHKNRNDKRDIPESLEMGGEAQPEDPFMPLKYECTTLHISLDSLDLLTDRRMHPNTEEFEDVARAQKYAIMVVSRIRTGSQLGAVTLEEVDGRPYVAVVKRPDKIVIEDLSTRARSTLECVRNMMYLNLNHSIWNLKIIPSQRQILVVRRAESPPGELMYPHLFEIFAFPEQKGNVTAHPIEFRIYLLEKLRNIQISDLRSAPADDASVWPQLNIARPPPPISIYCCKEEEPTGLIHFSIPPVPLEFPLSPPQTPIGKRRCRVPSKYHYSIAAIANQNNYKMPPRLVQWGNPRVLTGACRALVYTVPRGSRSISPPLLTLCAYISPERESDVVQDDAGMGAAAVLVAQDTGPDGVEREELEERERVESELEVRELALWPTPRKKSRRNCLPNVLMHPYLVEQVRKGVSAIAWDEGSGRVCITTPQDGQLHIMDFAYQRQEDDIDKSFYREIDQPLAVDHIEVD